MWLIQHFRSWVLLVLIASSSRGQGVADPPATPASASDPAPDPVTPASPNSAGTEADSTPTPRIVPGMPDVAKCRQYNLVTLKSSLTNLLGLNDRLIARHQGRKLFRFKLLQGETYTTTASHWLIKLATPSSFAAAYELCASRPGKLFQPTFYLADIQAYLTALGLDPQTAAANFWVQPVDSGPEGKTFGGDMVIPNQWIKDGAKVSYDAFDATKCYLFDASDTITDSNGKQRIKESACTTKAAGICQVPIDVFVLSIDNLRRSARTELTKYKEKLNDLKEDLENLAEWDQCGNFRMEDVDDELNLDEPADTLSALDDPKLAEETVSLILPSILADFQSLVNWHTDMIASKASKSPDGSSVCICELVNTAEKHIYEHDDGYLDRLTNKFRQVFNFPDIGTEFLFVGIAAASLLIAIISLWMGCFRFCAENNSKPSHKTRRRSQPDGTGSTSQAGQDSTSDSNFCDCDGGDCACCLEAFFCCGMTCSNKCSKRPLQPIQSTPPAPETVPLVAQITTPPGPGSEAAQIAATSSDTDTGSSEKSKKKRRRRRQQQQEEKMKKMEKDMEDLRYQLRHRPQPVHSFYPSAHVHQVEVPPSGVQPGQPGHTAAVSGRPRTPSLPGGRISRQVSFGDVREAAIPAASAPPMRPRSSDFGGSSEGPTAFGS